MLEMPLLGVETVLRFRRDAWLMVKRVKTSNKMSTPLPPSRALNDGFHPTSFATIAGAPHPLPRQFWTVLYVLRSVLGHA